MTRAETYVSVVIDTYNTGHLIRHAIESVLRQDYPGSLLEIIVVDDGSTDDTRLFVEPYVPRVRYVWKENGGQASAINEGLRHVHGSVVCLLDGDDFFYPSKVRSVVDIFERFPSVGLVYNRYDVTRQDGMILKNACPTALWTGDIRDRTLLGYSWGCITSAMSFRTSVMESLEIPEEPFRVSADYFLANILPLISDVGFAEETLTAWVSHGSNAWLSNSTGSSPELNRCHRAAIIDYAEKRLGKHFLTYLGRAGFGEGMAPKLSPWSLLVLYARETSQITRANVDPRLKLRAQAKLTASILPVKFFMRLKALSVATRLTPMDDDSITK
jgi:glycosyltransferase involved in cell wall biosynthesis